MRCLKCGREIKDPEVFCELCQEDMSAYPVKPGTPIQLPHRAEAPKKKPPKKKKQLKPEEQIPRLRSNIRLLSLALTGLLIAFVLAVLMVVYLLDQRDGVNTIFWFLN
jgi:hypothetical protein